MKHFELSEFDSPDKVGSGENMLPSFLEKIDLARDISQVPYKINSGYRTKDHNQVINGSLTSSHLIGVACDIHCTDSHSRERIVYGLIKAGFTRIGIAKTFIHADTDSSKNPALWLY